MEARIESTVESRSLEFPTPAEIICSTTLPNPESVRRSIQKISQDEKNAKPRSNASTKQKRGVPLNIFEKTEKTPEVNTITRRRSKAKDNR